jgi:antitoxin HicB
MNAKRIGSRLEDFLRDDGILEDVRRLAAKKALALQLRDQMKKRRLSKVAMARRMHTSRSSLDRVLDPANSAITLEMLERAAAALGRRLRVELA